MIWKIYNFVAHTQEQSISSPYPDPCPGPATSLWSRGSSEMPHTAISQTPSLSPVYTCQIFPYMDLPHGITP